MNTSKAQKQLQYIQDFLIKIAGGDYDSKLPIINENDEQLVAVQVGINMLVEELKETTISRVFLDSIYNGINDILIVLNENGEIQNVNHVAASLLLYSESELANEPVQKLIEINDVDNAKNCIKNAFQHSKIEEEGLNFTSKNGLIIPMACSFSPLYGANKKITGVLLVAKNISTLINAKNQLQDKNDELNLFVYKASHDLKSPVTSMMGLMSLLNTCKDVQEMKIYTKMMDECIGKLNTVISDLLVLGQITYGELEYSEIDIEEVIGTTLKSIEFVDGFKEISFNITVEEKAKLIKTEKGLFQTILLNLIDNSIKYRQEGSAASYIKINVSAKEKGILVEIADNGIGIAEQQQANVFKMFYRATSASKGSGLGLYIVKTSVLKLGGVISIDSVLGEGTTFKMYIPHH